MITAEDNAAQRFERRLVLTFAVIALVMVAGLLAWAVRPKSALSPQPAGLRGELATSLKCPDTYPGPVVHAKDLAEPPTELLLCPYAIPGTNPSADVRLAASDQRFDQVITALSRPNEPTPTDQVCAAYADAPYDVLATTPQGVTRLVIPTDSCGRYQTDVIKLLRSFADSPTP